MEWGVEGLNGWDVARAVAVLAGLVGFGVWYDRYVARLEAKAALDKKLETIGNLVHDSVPVSDNEVI